MAYQRNFKINQSKNAIYRKFIRAKNLYSKKIYHLKFKRYKSMIKNLTRINKWKYYKTFFIELKANSKQIWEAVRSLINTKIKSNKKITYLYKNNQIETTSKTIPDAFNKFFSTIAKGIDNKIIPTNKTHKDYLNASIHGCSNHLNLEMEAECLMKTLSYLNLNISRTKNGGNKL